MSKKFQITFACPYCKAHGVAELIRTIWGEIPSNRELVFSDKINRITCQQCGRALSYPTSLMFTNADLKFAIWYEPEHDPEIDADSEVFAKHGTSAAYLAKAPRIKRWEDFKTTIRQFEQRASSGPASVEARQPKTSWFSKSLKGIFDPRTSGESIIERQEANYREFAQMYPKAEPHQLLSMVYLSRMKTHGKNLSSETMQAEALATTFEYSCLPFPISVRALGIALVNFERPDILKQCPDLEAQYSEYMKPVREARQRGQCDALYRRYNPRMSVPDRWSPSI